MIRNLHTLTVKINGTIVGTLEATPEGNAYMFQYDSNWLIGGYSISPLELPLSSETFISNPQSFHGGFAIFEDSLPDGYGIYLLDRLLRKEHSLSINDLNPIERLAVIGNKGMGALTYEPLILLNKHRFSPGILPPLDVFQEQALDILSEKSDTDPTLLYYNSSNSGGARPKITMKDDAGRHWLVKFRHTYDPYEYCP